MTDRVADLSFQKSFVDPHQPVDLLFSDACPPSGISIQLNADRLHSELNEQRRLNYDFGEEMPDWDSAMEMPNDRDTFDSRFVCETTELRANMGINEIDSTEDHEEPVPEIGYSPQRPEKGEVETQNAVSPIQDSSPNNLDELEVRTFRRVRRYKSSASKMFPAKSCLPPSQGDCPFFTDLDRENVYEKHYSLIKDWQYSDEEQASLRYKIENLCREHCMAYCILAQMLLTPEEFPGCREVNPWPDCARQALFALTVGDHWAIYNLAILVAFADKIHLEDHSTRFFDQTTIPFRIHQHAFWSESDFRKKLTLAFRRILLED